MRKVTKEFLFGNRYKNNLEYYLDDRNNLYVLLDNMYVAINSGDLPENEHMRDGIYISGMNKCICENNKFYYIETYIKCTKCGLESEI